VADAQRQGVKRLLLAAALCAPAVPAAALDEDPAQAFAAFEKRVLAAQHVLIEAHVTASGALQAQLQGRAEFNPRNHLALSFRGALAGAARELQLQADGGSAALVSAPRLRDSAAPPVLNYAVLLGLTRAGLLHNLARLANLELPERAEGGAGRWITVENFHHPTYALAGPLEGAFAFGFDLVANGQIVGAQRLWLDPVSGLPRRREQTLQSPQGEVQVTEDYDRILLE
jgi:hypothetical protein